MLGTQHLGSGRGLITGIPGPVGGECWACSLYILVLLYMALDNFNSCFLDQANIGLLFGSELEVFRSPGSLEVSVQTLHLQGVVTDVPDRGRPVWNEVRAVFLQTCSSDPKEAVSLLRPFIIYKVLRVYMTFYETQRQGPCPVD